MYLSVLLVYYTLATFIRSTVLIIPWFSTDFGKRSFSYLAATVWNEIHLDIRLSPTTVKFKRHLKTYSSHSLSVVYQCQTFRPFINPSIATLKLHSNRPSYSRGLGGERRGGDWVGLQHTQSPPRCTKCNSPPINGQCANFILFDVALYLPLESKGLTYFLDLRTLRSTYVKVIISLSLL